MESRKQRLGLTVVSWVALGAFASLIFWVVWSLLYPFQVLQVHKGSWTVTNPGKRVRRGEDLQVFVDYCATERSTPRMDMLIEQDNRVMLLETQYPAANDDGCFKKTLALTKIPRVMALESTSAAGTGVAKLQVTFRYRINALREVQYSYETDEFIIDP